MAACASSFCRVAGAIKILIVNLVQVTDRFPMPNVSKLTFFSGVFIAVRFEFCIFASMTASETTCAASAQNGKMASML